MEISFLTEEDANAVEVEFTIITLTEDTKEIGSIEDKNGDKHAGEYFRDKIHGFGVYHFPNGHYYEGAWHEGRKQRYGTYGFITGDTECGEWDDGNRLSPETGLLRKAVQSAQEMARKGVDQRRVHEQWYGL
ncbi:unnamed protein product [Brassica napus]|uniref:(rape) hypothetical protein n=1 Tax=Brassica napus TaxID=3708 RepID=A0A816QJT6_BRANA|nr:unnamed protein product [Brassica napus]